MEKSKKLTKFIIVAVAAWIIVTVLCGMSIQAAAGDQSDTGELSGQLKKLEAPTNAMKDADGSSDIGAEFATGDLLYVTGEADGWYTIYYHNEILYVDSTVPMRDVDHSDEIRAELTGISATDTAWINEYQMQVRAIKTARTWRIVIAVLVVVFILVTVISTVMNNKNKEKDSLSATPAS